MSEWNVIHENFHTKHSVLTAPDEHMPYIWSVDMISIGEKRRRKKAMEKGGGGGGTGGGSGTAGSQKDWAELYGCIK